MRFAPVLRSFDMFMVALLIGVVAWTFKVKFDSQEALDRVAELERQIEAEKTEIDLLRSDWSLLTSPSRLQKLVDRYRNDLQLNPIEPAQLTDDTQLPPVRNDILNEQIVPADEGFANIENIIETDSNVITGSIPSSHEELVE